jgi:hypothetical protein
MLAPEDTQLKGNKTFSTNFKSWLFAVPGSPNNKTLMSPLNRMPSGNTFFDPPKRRQEIAFLISDET